MRRFCLILAALSLAASGGCQQGKGRSPSEVYWDANRAFERGDYETAAADYQEYIEVRPGDTEGRLGLGKSLLILGRADEATDHLWVAYDAKPRDDSRADLLAEAMYQAGQTQKLVEFLRERTEQPGRVQDYLTLGRYAALCGLPDEAEPALLTAAKLDRGVSLEPQLALADFYESIGANEMALERYRMALWIDRENEEIKERVRALGEIPGPTFAIIPEEAGGGTP
ncbi:MAG: tetratricopeptide repeat protein [Phycisphaerales bacterium JB039]